MLTGTFSFLFKRPNKIDDDLNTEPAIVFVVGSKDIEENGEEIVDISADARRRGKAMNEGENGATEFMLVG